MYFLEMGHNSVSSRGRCLLMRGVVIDRHHCTICVHGVHNMCCVKCEILCQIQLMYTCSSSLQK